MYSLNFSKKYFFLTLCSLVLGGWGSVVAAMEEQKHSDPKKSFVIVMGSQDSGKSTLVGRLIGETLQFNAEDDDVIEYTLAKSNNPRPAIKEKFYGYETKICTAYPAADFKKSGIMLYDTPGMYTRDPSERITHEKAYLQSIQSLLATTTPLKGIVLTFSKYDFTKYNNQKTTIFQEVITTFVDWFARVDEVKKLAPSICMVIKAELERIKVIDNIIDYAKQVAQQVQDTNPKDSVNLQKQHELLNIFYKAPDNPQPSSAVKSVTQYMEQQGVEHVLFIGPQDLVSNKKNAEKHQNIAKLNHVINNFKGIESEAFASLPKQQQPPKNKKHIIKPLMYIGGGTVVCLVLYGAYKVVNKQKGVRRMTGSRVKSDERRKEL